MTAKATKYVGPTEGSRETGAQLVRSGRKYCYYIPTEGYVEERGWRPSIVFEGESGHFPNGDWPYEGKGGQKAPWFWGHDYNAAVKIAAQMNERMGIGPEEALRIVTSSMAVSGERRHGKS